jgi:hypothetical protein
MHESYQPDTQRPERLNGFPPDFDPIFPFTLSETCCDTFVRAHPELPIARRDYFLSKAFQFLYTMITLRYWPHAGSLMDPMAIRGAGEIRGILQESLDWVSAQDLPKLCAPELDWWWAVYSDTLNYDLEWVLKRLQRRFRNIFKSKKRSKNVAAPGLKRESEIGAPQASHLGAQSSRPPSAIKPDASNGPGLPAATDRGAVPIEHALVTSVAGGTPDKGNLNILRGIDGQFKKMVTIDVARRFGGVTRRSIENAANKGSLRTEGRRQQRRVLVESLLKYFPPER